jgi:Raf kinase inhibitor-like YbhB/YbcL family protein
VTRTGPSGDAMDRIKVDIGFSQFPVKFTCDGLDVSPRIALEGVNGAALVLIMDDPDAPSGLFTHWIAWNMDPVEEVPEGVPKKTTVDVPIRAVQGRNTSGRVGYMGPCPPRGRPHRYFLRVFVLDGPLSLPPGASRAELDRALEGHVIQSGEAMATYARGRP